MENSQLNHETEPPVSPLNDPRVIKTLVKTSYNAIAPKYQEWTVSSHSLRVSYLEEILPHLAGRLEATVLELGCGAGVPTTQLLAAQPNITVTANDISTAQLALAASHLAGSKNPVTFIEADMMALSFSDSSFDAVVAMYSLLHLPREEQVALLQRIGRWVKAGGWLLANFGAEADEGSVAESWLGEGKGMYWSAWGVERTCELVKDAGFEVRKQDVIGQVEGDEEGGKEEREERFLWVLGEKVDGEE